MNWTNEDEQQRQILDKMRAKIKAKHANIVEDDQIRKDDLAFLRSCGIAGQL